jgi:hypothetical protein
LDELGRVAAIGDIAHRDGYSIRVESVRGTQIAAVRIRDHEPERAATLLGHIAPTG